MSRSIAALVTIGWLVPATAAAQVSLGSGQVPGITIWSNSPAPAPPAAPPPSAQPPIAGPPPGRPIGGSMMSVGGDQFLAGPLTYAPRYRTKGWRNDQRYPLPGYGYGFGYSTYGPGYVPDVGVGSPYSQPEQVEGRLYLRVIPGTAQVFVDGLYVGVADDFSGSGLSLDAGPRRVELRADGYETVTFDVRIVPGETVSYRKDLARVEARPEVPRVAAIPKTFYVIPRCYAGDTPPQAEDLPRGCRVANMRTVPPTVSSASDQAPRPKDQAPAR
jgi:hypothetical protein